MSRLQTIDPEATAGKTQELLGVVKAKLGMVPNMTRIMANSPAVLEGYLALSGAVSKGRLSAKHREQIALAIAEANGCDYCLAAHSAVGRMVGLTPDEVSDSRRGEAVDAKADALLHFARQVVDQRGNVSDTDVAAVRAAGFGDDAIAEVVANVALHVFTNYFNLVAATEVDFPKVKPLAQYQTR